MRFLIGLLCSLVFFSTLPQAKAAEQPFMLAQSENPDLPKLPEPPQVPVLENKAEPQPEKTPAATEPPAPSVTPPKEETAAAPALSDAEITSALARCAGLPDKLDACQAFTCQHPGLEEARPNFIRTRSVTKEENGLCNYSESMPDNVTLQCRFSAKGRSAYSAYLRSFLSRKPLDEATGVAYSNAQTNECQLINDKGGVVDPKLYHTTSRLPEDINIYGAPDTPKGDCQTLNEKLDSCELFYCKGNDPIQEKFFNRTVEVERKIIGTLDKTCVYVQKTGGKDLVGCKHVKTDSTSAAECSQSMLVQIAESPLFNRLTLAERAAQAPAELKTPAAADKVEKKKKQVDLSTLDYKTQTLPGLIYKKQYDKTNKDLPVVQFPADYPPLAFAALDRNDLAALKALIAKVKTMDEERPSGQKPLGGIEMRGENGNTLLIHSVMLGNYPAASMLLGQGADVDARNTSGVTALQAAAYVGRADLVELLLGMGAKPDIADTYGRTALSHAIEKNDRSIINLLMQKGEKGAIKGPAALITAAKIGNAEAVVTLLDNHVPIDARDADGKTALMHAAEKGQIAVINALIMRGANVFLQDKFGQTAETIAANAGQATAAERLAGAAIDRRLSR